MVFDFPVICFNPLRTLLSGSKSIGSPRTLGRRSGEEAIEALGFRQLRQRCHGELGRIEIARDEMERALSMELGQRFIAIC